MKPSLTPFHLFLMRPKSNTKAGFIALIAKRQIEQSKNLYRAGPDQKFSSDFNGGALIDKNGCCY